MSKTTTRPQPTAPGPRKATTAKAAATTTGAAKATATKARAAKTGTTKTAATRIDATRPSARRRATGTVPGVDHPRSVPTLPPVPELEQTPEFPFAEGVEDQLDPDLRHRMISERAYHLYEQRGYEDGYDLDDWLAAEAEIDHRIARRSQEP